jgi:hypothetical protein
MFFASFGNTPHILPSLFEELLADADVLLLQGTRKLDVA